MTWTGRLALAAAVWLCVPATAAQRDGPPAEALIRQGLLALRERNVPRAQDFLERALERSPGEARAWIGLAQAYRMLNLHGQAMRHAKEAERLGKDNPLIQHALAMFHVEYGNLAEAARWEDLFARGPQGGMEAYVRALSLYLQAGMPLQATEVGLAALETGESATLHNALGKAYAMADRPDEGLHHLERAVEIQAYDESFHYDLGYFHLRRQDFEAAAATFRAGQEYFDKSAAIEIGLGIAAYGQRRFPEAVDRFLRAAQLAPDMEQPHAFLGRLLQHASDRLDEVEERFRVFHEQYSRNHFGPLLYGQSLLARLGTGRDPEALAAIEDLFRESIDRKADYWESHYELGLLLEKKGDLAAAEERLEQAVELNPDASKPHYRLARIYQRLGKSKEAKRARETHRRITERERALMQVGGLPAGLAGASEP